MAIYTAWGGDGRANTFMEGLGPPGPGQWCPETDGADVPELIWTIEADSWEGACAKYHDLQGWEPYVPMDESRETAARLRLID